MQQPGAAGAASPMTPQRCPPGLLPAGTRSPGARPRHESWQRARAGRARLPDRRRLIPSPGQGVPSAPPSPAAASHGLRF